MDMVISDDGQTLYVAAYGSAKVAVFKTSELEADQHKSDPTSHIHLSGGGPAGLVLDEANQRLYVLTQLR